MLDFLLLKKKALERHLFHSSQIYESWLWAFWLALCLVGTGVGPWWAGLLLPMLFSCGLSLALAANFVRETRRFEWVDQSGIYLTPQPTLTGRFSIVVFKGLVIFFPLVLPLSDFGVDGLNWMVKAAWLLGAFVWYCALLIRSQMVLWRMALWRAALLVITAVVGALLPFGVLGMIGFWSRQAADLLLWEVFQKLEFYVSSGLVILGIPCLFFVIWQFSMFHIKGSRKPEGQRRRRMKFAGVKISEIKLLILLTLPWACWQGINHWNQREIRRILYEGDIQGAIDQIHQIPSGLKVGIPYRADYYDLGRLLKFHDRLLNRPVYLNHFSQLSKAWWQRHPQTKYVVSQLTVERIEKAYLTPAEKLLVAHLRLDTSGAFTGFAKSNGIVSDDVLAYLKKFKVKKENF